MDDLRDIDRKYIWHPFTPLAEAPEFPIIAGGKGCYLITSDGRKILDAVSSWWVNLHGHTNPEIAKAIADQAAQLEHVIFAGFTHEPAIRLAENLLKVLPPSQRKIFFSDNGSTAVEVALKLAIQYWDNIGKPKKKVIALKGSYHGDTFGAMSVAERGLFTKPFFPFLFETIFVDFPEKGRKEKVLDQIRSATAAGDVAAFIFEPLVQAAGGMRMYSLETLDQLIGYAQNNGIICIADEVFTGFGRTGRTFAVDHLVNKPDIMALSKGVTGGFMPLGVTSCSQKIVTAFESPSFDKTFFHGHSYTANPLACAAANASFRLLMDSKCQDNIRTIGAMHADFAMTIKDHRNVADARTLGTILAIELRTEEKTDYTNAVRKQIYPFFLERGILLRPLGNVIYVLPPYVITESELTHIYNSIRDFLDVIGEKK